MAKLFISDLHLQASRQDICDLFFKFLHGQATQAQALYILGDLFEVWIGDDDRSDFNQSVLSAIKQVVDRGIPVYFMRGNRDFIMGKDFQRDSGCEYLPDEQVIQIAGRPVLLMHGDTLCTRDVKYLKFRRKARNFWAQKLFLWKSLEKRRALADKARKASSEHTRSVAMDIMDVTQEEVERVMRKHGVTQLIHGHTHRPAVHEFEIGGVIATRTVLAPWHEQGSALLYHEDGRQEIIEIT